MATTLTSDSEEADTPRVSPEVPVAPMPAIAGIAEPIRDRQIHASPKVEAEHIYQSVFSEETEESDVDIFNDVVGELAESDEERFFSLNAVVESPITTSASTIPDLPKNHTTRVTRETAAESASSQNTDPAGSGWWDKAQEYWSSLSADKKRQAEFEALQNIDEPITKVERKPAPKPKKKNAVRSEPVVSNERSCMIQPGTNSGEGTYTPMRTSMRRESTGPVFETTMRKPMRGSGKCSMREFMRGSQASVQKNIRPVSLKPISKLTVVDE